MRTGSSDLWTIADRLGVVPTPPDPVLASLLTTWWTLGRRFGCVGARDADTWVVVMPSPAILCPTCAEAAFTVEDRCAYCTRPLRRSRSLDLLFEMNHGVRVVGRAHRHCAEQARKETHDGATT